MNNYSHLLLNPNLVSPDRLETIRRISELAALKQLPVYIVGGFVRDLLLNRIGTDFDLVIEGDAIKLARSLVAKFGGKVIAHPKFGTANIDIREWKRDSRNRPHFVHHDFPFSIDLISARSETYKHPASLPSVKMGDITDDLKRRDFTINAMAIRLDGDHWGEFIDPLGGQADLERGLIRVLHANSFIDDPTRMFRAVRYEKRYGFSIASESLKLIPMGRPGIEKLSPKRVRHELDLILDESVAAFILARLADLELLKSIHPVLRYDKEVQRRMSRNVEPPSFAIPDFSDRNLRWLLWLMDVSLNELMDLNSRLHFKANLMKSLRVAIKINSELASLMNLKPSQCIEKFENNPLLAIYAVFRAAPDSNSKRKLGKYLTTWRYVTAKMTGHDLKRYGLPPGPEYQSILRRLRNARLDGEVKTDEEEMKLLMEMLHRSERK